MTCEEITKIAKICLTADSWCSHCSSNLSMQLQEAFPEYAGVISSIDDHQENYRYLYNKACEDSFPGPEPKVWEIEL